MDVIGITVVLLVIGLVICSYALQNQEKRALEIAKRVKILELKDELNAYKSLPEDECEWLKEEGFDPKEAILDLERQILTLEESVN